MWLLEDRKCVISRNAMFREDLVYKDIQKVKEVEAKQEASGGLDLTRNIVEIGESSESAEEIQAEGGASEPIQEEEHQVSGEVEDLSNYQLAKDRTRREIVKPTRFTEDSELAFALLAAETIESEESNNYEEAMSSRD